MASLGKIIARKKLKTPAPKKAAPKSVLEEMPKVAKPKPEKAQKEE